MVDLAVAPEGDKAIEVAWVDSPSQRPQWRKSSLKKRRRRRWRWTRPSAVWRAGGRRLTGVLVCLSLGASWRETARHNADLALTWNQLKRFTCGQGAWLAHGQIKATVAGLRHHLGGLFEPHHRFELVAGAARFAGWPMCSRETAHRPHRHSASSRPVIVRFSPRACRGAAARPHSCALAWLRTVRQNA